MIAHDDSMYYHDPRAEEIATQIKQARAIIPDDPIFRHHVCYGGLSPVEAMLRHDIKVEWLKLFWNLRDQIWEKQIINGISGVCWVETNFCDKSIVLPELAENLVLAPGDKDIIISKRDEAIAWIEQFASAFKLWGITDTSAVECSWDDFLEESAIAEWVELSAEDDISRVYVLETGERHEAPTLILHISLCWGTPGHHEKLDSRPASGLISFQLTNDPAI